VEKAIKGTCSPESYHQVLRSVPTIPRHGFTLQVLGVFHEVLKKKTIDIVPLCAHGGYTLFRMENRYPTTQQSERQRIDPASIADTPFKRIYCDLPYAVRHHGGSGDPLNSFQQAAHDMRRMGWLRAMKHEYGYHVQVASRWHEEFIRSLLTPKTVPPRFETIDLIQFCLEAVGEFRRSVLKANAKCRRGSNRMTVPERVCQIEFAQAVSTLVDPCFLRPEVRSGSGWVDFVVPSRKWLIEFLRDGTAINEHVGRFDSNHGTYDTQGWEWVVLDFRCSEATTDHGKLFHFQPPFRLSLSSFPVCSNLYRVQFSDDFQKVSIWNNKREVVGHPKTLIK